MSLASHPLASMRELQRALAQPDALDRLFEGLRELQPLEPELVVAEVRALVESLNERRKTCDGCGRDTIGQRRPKRGQRAFCSEECGQAASQEDFRARRRGARSEP